MAISALLVGGPLLAVVLLLAYLQPDELLRPSRRAQLLAGAVGGAVAAGVGSTLAIYVPGQTGLYTATTAIMALCCGPWATAITAALTLLTTLAWGDERWLASSAAVAAVAGAAALGWLWRWAGTRPQLDRWTALAGLALTLPLWIALCLAVGAESPPLAVALAAQEWREIPWFETVGVLVLGAAHLVLAHRSKELSTLQSAHKDLAQREQQLRLMLQSTGGGQWDWDVQRQEFRCWGDFYAAFGVAAEGQSPADVWQRWYERRHPLDVQRNAEKLARARAGLDDNYEAEFRVQNLEGRWRWIVSRGIVARRDAQGAPISVIGIDMDITAHHEAQDALHSAEAKYTTFYQTLPDPAGITRISDGRYIDVNPAFCEVHGYTREQVIGRTSLELNIWATKDERAKLISTFHEQGQVDRLPLMALARGVQMPGLMSARSVLINGENCFIFVFHDITEAQRSSDEIRALYWQLQQAGRLARLGVWEDERGKAFIAWSDMCYEIHGLDPRQPPPRNYIDLFVAPAYREPMRDAIRQSLVSRTAWSLEMQIIRTDGRLLWVRALGEPVVENGQVVKVRGVVQDIDEAKRAEQRLRHSDERFSRIFALTSHPMGLVRCSTGEYVDINPAWVDLLGIPRAEAIGNTALHLKIVEPGTREAMLASVTPTGRLDDYEMTVHVRNGSPRTVLQSMRTTELDGEACWLFSIHDITDRKRNEEQLREREELLSLTLSAASLGLWDWNLQSGEVTGDPRWREMRGLAGAQADGTHPSQWTQAVAPDDIGLVTEELARHTQYPSTLFDATLRVTAPGEPVRWVRNLGKIVDFGVGGQPQRMVGVSIDVTPQREQEVMLQRLALFDALTGLPNRVLLARRLNEGMERARRSGTLLGVAYLDLDGFKPVNDRLGHGAGDRLLVVVAGRLTRSLRPQDSVARLGGDEFVILMPDLTAVQDCERMLRGAMESISAPYTLDRERIVVTASIGYTLFPHDDADADTLLRHADQAMYGAKQAGRNRFFQFDARQERAMELQRQQNTRLRVALADGQFVLYLQPKVDMRSGEVMGAEALIRWQHPEHGIVSPGEFLPLIEGTELEIELGEWVIEAAMVLMEQLQAHEQPLPISINLAAQHLQHPGFVAWMGQCMARHPSVGAQAIEIEITESAALYDLAAAAGALGELQALGVRVSLDDFGTGYSSLTYLRRLPMDTVKIDQSFVHGMMTDPGDLAIVQGVIGLARSFGYRVIAEGVETVEQGQMLLQLGCTQAQGYCIARPMPLAAFLDWAVGWQSPADWV